VIYLAAAAAGLVAAVLGWLVTGVATVWITGVFGMSDFEGQRGMFAFLAIGPLGGIAAMVTAIWLVVRAGRGRAALGPALARTGAVVAGLVALAAAAVGVRFLTLDTYTNELPPNLEFEVRLPAANAVADRGDVTVELHTDRNVGDGVLTDPWSRIEDGRQVIAGVVPLAFKTSSRLLVVTVPGGRTRLFRLPLSRDPASTAELGAWRHADHVHDAGQDQPVAAPKDDPVEIRYRVRRAGEE
jgi:hypothetical protein